MQQSVCEHFSDNKNVSDNVKIFHLVHTVFRMVPITGQFPTRFGVYLLWHHLNSHLAKDMQQSGFTADEVSLLRAD